MDGGLIAVRGGCHCGDVAWEAMLSPKIEARACNCSICYRVGFQHVICPKSRFQLLSDPDKISTYTFGHHVAQHYFCARCGVKSHYVPRSNPDGISLNLRCMDQAAFEHVEIVPFDGQNWEANAASLHHLSKE